MSLKQVKRRRAGNAKSHTGCRTCKLRRVKCDEVSPACTRCVQAGIECDGYDMQMVHYKPAEARQPDISASSGLDVETLLGPLTSLLQTSPLLSALSSSERSAFAFYENSLASLYDRTFNCVFWKGRVLQLSCQVPAVLNAVLGLSLVYQARMHAGDSYSSSILHDDFYHAALERHIQALAYMQALITSTPAVDHLQDGVVEIAVITCLLFDAFNLMQGDRAYATSHFRAGLRIFKQQKSRICNKSRDVTHKDSRAELRAAGLYELDKIYQRLDGVACFRIQVLPAWSRSHFSLSIPKVFKTLPDARRHLDILVNAVFQIRDELYRQVEMRHEMAYDYSEEDQDRYRLHLCCKGRALSSICTKLVDDMQMLREILAAWFKSFHQVSWRNESFSDIMRLRIKCIYTRFLLATLHKAEATACDEFVNDFSIVLDLAVQHARARLTKFEPGVTISDSGPDVLTAVYVAGLHCRDPLIRRRAIQILIDHQSADCPQDPKLLAGTIQKVMEMEETKAQALNLRSADRSPGSVTSMQDIPEEARFVEIRLCKDRNDQLSRILCGRVCSDGKIEIFEIPLAETLRDTT